MSKVPVDVKFSWYFVVFCLLVFSSLKNSAAAIDATTIEASSAETAIVTAPVIIDGIELLRVRGISSFPAERRAAEIADRIKDLAKNKVFDPTTLQITELPHGSSIVADKQNIITVFDADTRVENLDREVLAQSYLARVRETIIAYREARTPKALMTSASYIAVVSIAFGVFLWLGRRATRYLDATLNRRLRGRIEGLESQSFQIVRAKHIWTTLQGALKLFWIATSVMVGFWCVQFILGVLPWTRYVGDQLFNLLINPLHIMGRGLLAAIPDMIFIAMLILVARYLLKGVRVFFTGVAAGAITFGTFEPEWSWPTYRLVRTFIIAFTLVLAFPYIPGSSSDAFKGVSVFIGIIFSLGSSSVIANIIAGYTMTYRRAFKLGDRIQVGEYTGDVTESRLLVTHLHTAKNEEIVVPNSLILNQSVVNFSTLARTGQLLLHTTVGIGYETPWRQVEAMLLQAASQTPKVAKDPAPFVLQKSLGDFCVTYELNAYCGDAHAMNEIYSSLHRNILDVFNEYDVAIMTPAYVADPPEAKVVPKARWFTAPAKSPSK